MTKPMLLIGGYGITGAPTARLLRERNPELPLVLAGRTPEQGQSLAEELGNASVAVVDFTASELGVASADFSAMILFAKDHTGNSLEYAGRHAIPYYSLSSGAFEIGLDMTHGLIGARGAPIVLGSLWFAGLVPLAAAEFGKRFASIDKVDVAVVIDRSETPPGEATIADFQRITMCPATLVRENSAYNWIMPDQARGSFRRSDGTVLESDGAVSCDVWSVGQITGAPNVRVHQAFDQSASSASGGPAADEVIIRMEGGDANGAPLALEQTIIAYREPYAITPIVVAIIAERLAGVSGASPAPGLYSAENAIESAFFMEQVRGAGVSVTTRQIDCHESEQE